MALPHCTAIDKWWKKVGDWLGVTRLAEESSTKVFDKGIIIKLGFCTCITKRSTTHTHDASSWDEHISIAQPHWCGGATGDPHKTETKMLEEMSAEGEPSESWRFISSRYPWSTLHKRRREEKHVCYMHASMLTLTSIIVWRPSKQGLEKSSYK